MNPTHPFKKGIAWGLYDFANSGYFLVYVILTFPLFLSSTLMANDRWFETKWGVAQGTAILLAIFFGLIFGKAFDRVGIEKVVGKSLIAAGLASLALPFLIAFHVSGNILLIAFAFVHALYLFSLTIYDSSLKHVATGVESVEVSGWAWGWGYVGGITCMGFMALGNIFWDEYSPYSFFVASGFFLVFSYLAARSLQNKLKLFKKEDNSAPVVTIENTSGKLIQSKSRIHLLLLFILIVDGIAIFMGFFSLYATKVVHALDSDVTKMLAVLQILAFPLTGLLSGIARKSFRSLLFFCSAAWGLAGLLIVFVPSISVLWVCVCIMAGAVGTTQALLRALYADTLSKNHAISGFSVFAIVEKGAAFIGPVVAGILIPFVGYSKVLLTAGVMVALGCILIAKVVKK